MHASPQSPAIEYTVFSPSDTEKVAALLAHSFSSREPIALAVGITAAEFAAFVRLQLYSAETQALTVIARRSDTGEMVGALLAEDGASDSGAELDKLGEKFAMVGSILGRLVETYGNTPPAPGEMLHLFLLGVSLRAEGLRVGQQLVAACIANAASKGYRRASAECTGRVSQHVFRKLGFEDRGMIDYVDHEFNGRRIFASIAEHGGPILMERSLQPEQTR
jgi:ribosomal protein S18 acetylase RimI-like enzyme